MQTLVQTPLRAGATTAGLWLLALASLVFAFAARSGGSIPLDAIGFLLVVLLIAPVVLAAPAVPLLLSLGLSPDELAYGVAIVALSLVTLAGYWGPLLWLSWRVAVGGSTRALLALTAALMASVPFWFFAVQRG